MTFLCHDFGSGWGTVYSKDYDPEIAENERGGGTWDNQAFFDFNGKVLPSLNVYKWVYTGAVGSTKVKRVAKTSVVMNLLDYVSQFLMFAAMPDAESVYKNSGLKNMKDLYAHEIDSSRIEVYKEEENVIKLFRILDLLVDIYRRCGWTFQ